MTKNNGAHAAPTIPARENRGMPFSTSATAPVGGPVGILFAGREEGGVGVVAVIASTCVLNSLACW